MANIAVIMTTYAPDGPVGDARKNYAWESVHSLLTHLRGAEFRLHIADDGSSDQEYIRNLVPLAKSMWPKHVTNSNSERRGIGASLNLALDNVSEHIWMYTTDDWMLTSALDVGLAVDLIEKLGYDYVRVGTIHPHLMCSTEFNQELGWWVRIHQKWGGYAFATRPFLATREFYYNVGRFLEGVDSYLCEKEYNERVCHMEHLKLACLPDVSGHKWRHIGIQNVGADYTPVSIGQ